MLGDAIELLVDEGGRAPEKVTVTAGSGGGTVKWEDRGDLIRVDEFTKAGRSRRAVLVRKEKLIRLTELPRG
jgi:hypothetical protein